MHGQHGVEEVGEVNAVGLRRQAKGLAVSGERAGVAADFDLQMRFIATVEQLGRRLAIRAPVGEFYGRRAVPARVDDGDSFPGNHAEHPGAGTQVF